MNGTFKYIIQQCEVLSVYATIQESGVTSIMYKTLTQRDAGDERRSDTLARTSPTQKPLAAGAAHKVQLLPSLVKEGGGRCGH
jgi:hypothetical protein